MYGFFPAKNRDDVRGANFHTIAVTPDHDRVTSSGSQGRTMRAANPSGRTRERCVVCGQPHKLFQCELYKGMQPVDRFEIAKRNKLCYNCLLAGHVSNKCYKQSMCTVFENGIIRTMLNQIIVTFVKCFPTRCVHALWNDRTVYRHLIYIFE